MADPDTSAKENGESGLTDDGQPENSRSSTGDPGLTVAQALGETAWLLSQSPNHRHALFLADLEWLALPPVSNGQFKLFRQDGRPIGVALWAYLSEEAENRLEAGIGKLATDDWRSGPNLWLVELIAPFGQQEAMVEDLKTTVLAGQTFKLHRRNEQGKRETVTVGGEAGGSEQ
jgi:cytolysin-activating lysine-acyltransferase